MGERQQSRRLADRSLVLHRSDAFDVPCHTASLRWSTSDRSANRRHCCLSPTAPSPEGHYPSASTRRPIVEAESKRSRAGQLLVHAKLHTRLEECELALPNAMSTSPASVCGARNRYVKVDGEAAAHVQSVHSLRPAHTASSARAVSTLKSAADMMETIVDDASSFARQRGR